MDITGAEIIKALIVVVAFSLAVSVLIELFTHLRGRMKSSDRAPRDENERLD